MALTRWILALCGYARLEVCGVHPERVLNACAAAGIACTASEPVDAYTLRITVRARCAETAAELARRCQCEVKTLYRRGLPQLLRRAARYRGACAGLLVAVLAVLTSSLFIWRIDVTGNETLTTGQILRCLDECGVRPGTYWPALSNDLVRNDMILRLPELRIEQAAFLTAPRCGGEIRLEMMGGEFCGNALRCAGFYHALRTGAQGKTCVLAEISGAEGVQPVMADTAAGEASTVMPLPRAVQPADWPDVQAVRVTFDGITHFVMDRAQPDDALVQRAIAAAPEASAVGALFLDRAAGSMQPVVFVRETGSCVAETSCASGSVATAVVLTADFGDGITEIGIGQPGGTLEVGVQRAHGAVTGLSIGGPVRLAQTLTVALADAPC